MIFSQIVLFFFLLVSTTNLKGEEIYSVPLIVELVSPQIDHFECGRWVETCWGLLGSDDTTDIICSPPRDEIGSTHRYQVHFSVTSTISMSNARSSADLLVNANFWDEFELRGFQIFDLYEVDVLSFSPSPIPSPSPPPPTFPPYFNDPQYDPQWFLHNWEDPLVPVYSFDSGITQIWSDGYTGNGINIAFIVEDFDFTNPHHDLQKRFLVSTSHRFVDEGGVWVSDYTNGVVSIAVAEANNSVCGVGVAHESSYSALVAPNFYSLEDSLQSNVLEHETSIFSIYVFAHPHFPIGPNYFVLGENSRVSIEKNIQERGGLGNILIWPVGDGKDLGENCNQNGFANSPYTITVGSMVHSGHQANYSSDCSALMFVAPSHGDGRHTPSASSNPDKCSGTFDGGTTVSASYVAGIVSLMLSARPELSWRDVQQILITTAIKLDLSHSDWIVNGKGHRFSHHYGFGLVNAKDAVRVSTTHELLSFENYGSVSSGTIVAMTPLPDVGSIYLRYECKDDVTVEHVQVKVQATHTEPGDIRVSLISPAGTKSILSTPHGVAHREISLQIKNRPSIYLLETRLGVRFQAPESNYSEFSFPSIGSSFDDCVPGYPCACNTISKRSSMQILLVFEGNCPIETQVFNAQSAGAKAVFIISEDIVPQQKYFGPGWNIEIPSALIGRSDGLVLKNMIMPGTSELFIDMSVVVEISKFPNIPMFDKNWLFGTVANWGEKSLGTWTLEVEDTFKEGDGAVQSWTLIIHGDIHAHALPSPSPPSPFPLFSPMNTFPSSTTPYPSPSYSPLPPPKFNDPLFHDQWHLNGGNLFASVHLGLDEVWAAGHFGESVTICLIDSFVNVTHPDISSNLAAENTDDIFKDTPEYIQKSSRGTQLATLAAGVANNHVCGVGVSPSSKLYLIRQDTIFSDEQEATLFEQTDFETPQVYLATIRPPDDGFRLGGPGPLTAEAMRKRALRGRHGRGDVLIWGAGDGKKQGDFCNFDGYANSIYTIAVGAASFRGDSPEYSETCASILVVAPSKGAGGAPGITTGDIASFDDGEWKNCTQSARGSDLGAAQVAGVVSLLLGAYPDLSWRDVQGILIQGAQRSILRGQGEEWKSNGAGNSYHPSFGFGLVSAHRSFRYAQNWNRLPPLKALKFERNPSRPLPSNSFIFDSVNVKSNLTVEQVQLSLFTEHPFTGDMRISLISPSGTESLLAPPRGIMNRRIKLDVGVVDHNPRTMDATEATFGQVLPYKPKSFLGFYTPLKKDCHSYPTSSTAEVHILRMPEGETSETCPYVRIARYAQEAGARLVLIVPSGDSIEPMTGIDSDITIPALMIGKSDADWIMSHRKRWHPTFTTNVLFSKIAVPQYTGWTFSSVHFWGESSQGDWALWVEDEIPQATSGEKVDTSGILHAWNLTIYGSGMVNREDQEEHIPDYMPSPSPSPFPLPSPTPSPTPPTPTSLPSPSPTPVVPPTPGFLYVIVLFIVMGIVAGVGYLLLVRNTAPTHNIDVAGRSVPLLEFMRRAENFEDEEDEEDDDDIRTPHPELSGEQQERIAELLGEEEDLNEGPDSQPPVDIVDGREFTERESHERGNHGGDGDDGGDHGDDDGKDGESDGEILSEQSDSEGGEDFPVGPE